MKMKQLYLKKLKFIPIYFVVWVLLFLLCNTFLGAFLEEAAVSVCSIIAITIVIFIFCYKKRYNNIEAMREYISNVETFKIKYEIPKVIRMDDFIADFWIFVTFAVVLFLITASGLLSDTHVLIWLLAIVIGAALVAVVASVVDIACWILVRYNWYRERIEG